MSESKANPNLEDVLSSVKLLVNESQRVGRGVAGGTPRDKFVLTPQLRVSTHGVLKLRPEDAAGPLDVWRAFESADKQEAGQDAVSAETDVHRLPVDETSAGQGGEKNASNAESGPKLVELAQVKPDDLSAKIAALETAIARTQDQWEPDGAGRDAYSGTQAPAMTWRNDVELDATGAPLNQDGELPLDAALNGEARDGLPDQGQFLDEAELRDLVAEIVRSELQGALGEQITQNVRKLVRREIQRALIAQKKE